MPEITIPLHLDDSLRYKVLVSKAVPRGEVTISVRVTVVVNTKDGSNAEIDSRIRAALKEFIPADWDFVDYVRRGLTPGFDQLTVQALTKVAATENRNLEDRARRANREGIEFGEISVNRSLPQDQVNNIVKDLWFETVTRVNTHIAEFNRTSGRVWRIGEITYGVPAGGGRRPPAGKGAYRDQMEDMLADMDEAGLSGAEKISMVAEVVLKSPRLEIA